MNELRIMKTNPGLYIQLNREEPICMYQGGDSAIVLSGDKEDLELLAQCISDAAKRLYVETGSSKMVLQWNEPT